LSDQALGPWLPWLAGRPHVVHCHDLLALEASLGKQYFHQISTTGRIYQNWIYSGFRRGRYFISVSAATKNILDQYLTQKPKVSVVLHNPLPSSFHLLPENEAKLKVGSVLPELNNKSFLLHIGRNWYKNRLGVLSIWEQLHKMHFPQNLVLVGRPDEEMQNWLNKRSNLKAWLHVLDAPSDQLVVSLYNRASLLLFPSHVEGFGWPIVEALACGCPVVTTNRPPMSEIGGEVVTKIPPAPFPPDFTEEWAYQSACIVRKVLSRTETEKKYYLQQGIAHSYRFNMEIWLDKLEEIYDGVLSRQERY
jgi:glycosyltransferase involved in cell wall biosynthesis